MLLFWFLAVHLRIHTYLEEKQLVLPHKIFIQTHNSFIFDHVRFSIGSYLPYHSIIKKWKDPLNSKVDPCIDISNHDSLFMRQAKLQQSKRGMLLSPKKYEWNSMISGLNYLAIKWFYLVGNSSTTCKYHGSWPFDKPTPHDWWHEKRKKEKRVLEVKA